MEIKFNSEISQKYGNLNIREVPLSKTGMSSRVFNYCKNNNLIDYKVDLPSGKRERVKLNYFEVFWVMMVKEFRGFGMSDKFVLEMKQFFHTPILELLEDSNINLEETLNGLKQNITSSDVNLDEVNEANYREAVKNAPDNESIYATYLGSLIGTLILTNESPIFNIFYNTNPEKIDEIPYVIVNASNAEVVDVPLGITLSKASISFPIRAIYESVFELEISDESFNNFRLLSDRETKIISLIRSGDFKECIIKNIEGEPIIKVKNKGEIIGDKVKEIRRLLGAKDYNNITLKFRNDKHIYYENER